MLVECIERVCSSNVFERGGVFIESIERGGGGVCWSTSQLQQHLPPSSCPPPSFAFSDRSRSARALDGPPPPPRAVVVPPRPVCFPLVPVPRQPRALWPIALGERERLGGVRLGC